MIAAFPWLALASCSDPGPAELADLDLGLVPTGATLDVRLPLPSAGAVSAGGFTAAAAGDTVTLSWAPTTEDETASATVTLSDGRAFVVSASAGPWPATLAEPPLVSQGYERLDSVAESGLGDADLGGEAPVPFALDPVTGNAFFGDAERGRAWRIDPFYNHPSWGLWVTASRSDADDWQVAPDCFDTPDGSYQHGGCTGEERDADGQIPEGWAYLHGGFAGDGELLGLTALAADPGRGRVWALGPGWLRAIDADLYSTSDEGGDPYTYLQLVPGVREELGGRFERPWAGAAGASLWVVDMDSGAVGRVPLAIDPGAVEQAVPGGWTDGARGAVGETELVVAGPGGAIGLDASGEGMRWSSPIRPRLQGAPIASATLDDRAVFVWPEALVLVEAGAQWIVPAPEGARLVGAAFDRISGGNAEARELLWVAGHTDGQGWLAALSTGGAWLGVELALAAPPRALGHGADAHDLYVLYAAGAEGCDGALAEVCDEDGRHPAVVETLYDPYSLVPPTSAGHPLNLFWAPVVETPQDPDLSGDFSGFCAGSEGTEQLCCALDWAVEERLTPNTAYVRDVLLREGDDPASLDDDPTALWTLNASVLRLARMCLDDPDTEDSGAALLDALAELSGPRVELAHLLHIGVESDEADLDWYLSLLYESGQDYVLPLESQQDYQRLHDGLSAVFDPSVLGEDAPDLSARVGGGNALDAKNLMVRGWDDASWATALRDGPLAVGQPTRHATFFLSAGADPAIGTGTGRKKELWPLDLRERLAVTGLSEDPADILAEDPDSGLYNLPGNSWQLGALEKISESGAFRESFKAEGDIDAVTWDMTLRYLRRTLASSDPDEVKVWYQHVLDVTGTDGLLLDNVVTGTDGDPNLAGLDALEALLIVPGYARWALPSEVIAEREAAR